MSPSKRFPLVLVDFANLHYALTTLIGKHWRIDWRKFRVLLTNLDKVRSEDGRGIDIEKLHHLLDLGTLTARNQAVDSFYTRCFFPVAPSELTQMREDHRETIVRLKDRRWWVIEKEMTPIWNGSRIVGLKGNVDVEIAYHVGSMFGSRRRERVRQLVLVSGDRDFVTLIKEAHRYQISVVVVASHYNLAGELRHALQAGDQIVMLEHIILEIQNGERREDKEKQQVEEENPGS